MCREVFIQRLMTTPSPLESRLARVERALAALSTEVAAIRAELRSPAENAARAEQPAAREASAERRARFGGLLLNAREAERLIGSYGMLGISVLAAVAAVGTFLSWAIGRGYLILGPPARVIIGLVFAAAIGVWGMRLRRRERSFGSSLMGLALVIVHVCAYAAGPSFQLVPTWVAFVGTASVSWGLALFAHAEHDEPLWCVGFGGAALAPFVTSDGHGSLYALLLYGAVVLLSACFAISRRSWGVAWRVFYLASALFIVAGAWQARFDDTQHFLAAFAFPFVIAIAGITPFAVPARKRGALRWLALLAVFPRSRASHRARMSRRGRSPTRCSRRAASVSSSPTGTPTCRSRAFWNASAQIRRCSTGSTWPRSRSFLPCSLPRRSIRSPTRARRVSRSAATFVISHGGARLPQRDAAAFAATMMAMAAVGALALETPTDGCGIRSRQAFRAGNAYAAPSRLVVHGLPRARHCVRSERGRALRPSRLSHETVLGRGVPRGAHRHDRVDRRRAIVARTAHRNARGDCTTP